jgi:hypothetical protein
MLTLFKRFILLSTILVLTSTVMAQGELAIVNDETDSLQDLQIENLEQQIDYMNLQMEVLKSLFRMNTQKQQLETDSLKLINETQADQIIQLYAESELQTKKLASAFKEIEQSHVRLEESKRAFKTVYFVTVPVLLLVALTILAILLVLLSRHKNSTNAKMNALRKYTYEGIEEVRSDYVNEIKRRVKKIASKLKSAGKKKKVKK